MDGNDTGVALEQPIVRALYLAEDPERPRLSFLQAVNALLRYRRLLIALPVVLAVFTVVPSLLSRRTYTASASFAPQFGSPQQSPLAGLAAQFGVVASGGSASPQFYGQLARSRVVRRRIVETPFTFLTERGARTASIADIYEVVAQTEGERLELAADELEGVLVAATDPGTSVVRVAATTAWPELSEQLVARVIDEVNRFNGESRQARAAAEADFVAERLQETQLSLRSAEDELQAFLERNRGGFENSPELLFEHDRLQRQVVMRQEVYTQLSQSLEQTRIDAVRDLPVITLVDTPRGSARANPRHTVRKGFVALALGLGLAVFIALARTLSGRAAEDGELREFRALREAMFSDLRRLLPSRASRSTG